MTTTPLTTADIDRMTNDDRWLGWGYLGERERNSGPAQHATDQRVIEFANHRGLTYDELFAWANSKDGRWFGDVMFGGAGAFEARWQEAVRHNLHPERRDYGMGE